VQRPANRGGDGKAQAKGIGMMAKKSKNVAKKKRVLFTKEDLKALRTHSKAKTPVAKIAKLLKRSVGSLRQKAMKLGLGIGHRR
jgi:hypothetical protein